MTGQKLPTCVSLLVWSIYSRFYFSNLRPLRAHLINGDFFVGSAIGSTLTKLALRFIELERDVIKQNVSSFECQYFVDYFDNV